MKLAIIIPRLDGSGPVRGALAAAKGLVSFCQVKLVVLKDFESNDVVIKKIEVEFLGNLSIYKKINYLKSLKNNNYKFISYCFYSDFLTVLSRCSMKALMNIRGNLYQNYYYDYGFRGLFLAAFHYFLSFFYKTTIVLNDVIKKHVILFNSNIEIIPNFIDEQEADKYLKTNRINNSKKTVALVYVGNIILRKGLIDLFKTLSKLERQNWHLTIIGDGILKEKLQQLAYKLGLKSKIEFLGKIDQPLKYLHNYDIFILPSYSEGTSRAAMEALHSGMKCVLRDVDRNNELIISDKQGYIFKDAENLNKILNDILINKPKRSNSSLLPSKFSYKTCIKRYEELLKNIN